MRERGKKGEGGGGAVRASHSMQPNVSFAKGFRLYSFSSEFVFTVGEGGWLRIFLMIHVDLLKVTCF